jgi:alpha-galactosidase
MTKIVIIGAGSVSFGPAMLDDLHLHRNVLRGSEVWLVDLDPAALELSSAYAARLAASAGDAPAFNVRIATNRREALPGADVVIVSVAVDRMATWRLDWQIPLRHGVRHVLGENGGPGGLSHALRNIPLLLSIARDIEALAPNALLLNFTNPASRLCLALHRHTRLRFVGLCHQIGEGYRLVNEVLRLVPKADDLRKSYDEAPGAWRAYTGALEQRYHIVAAGINHFTFALEIRDRLTGEDLYPALRAGITKMPVDFELMSRRLLDTFGLFCMTGDGHAGEYVGYAADTIPLAGFDFDAYIQRGETLRARLAAVVAGTVPPAPAPSGERAIPIIVALANGGSQHELSVNIPNRGCIGNLSDDAIVEVPGLVAGGRVLGVQVGDLPRGIAAMLAQQIEIQELVVEAAVTGSRTLALQALLLDPVIHSYAQAEHTLDDLLVAQAAYLPAFA